MARTLKPTPYHIEAEAARAKAEAAAAKAKADAAAAKAKADAAAAKAMSAAAAKAMPIKRTGPRESTGGKAPP